VFPYPTREDRLKGKSMGTLTERERLSILSVACPAKKYFFLKGD
jgi:hypothetical protein